MPQKKENVTKKTEKLFLFNLDNGLVHHLFGDDFGRLFGNSSVRFLGHPGLIQALFPRNSRRGLNFMRGIHHRQTKEFAGTVQGGVNVTESVLFTKLFEHAGARQSHHRLGMHATEQELRPFALATAKQIFNHLDTGGIDARHATHAEDKNLRLVGNAGHRILELVDRTKEQRTGEFVHHNALRHLAAELVVGGFLVVFLEGFRHRFHLGNIAHALDEEHRGQQNAHFDSDREVDNHREEEGHEHHDHVALGGLEHLDKTAVAAHVERHLEKYCRKRRHRDHFGILAEHEHDKEKDNRMHQARNRAHRTVTDVGRRTGNRTRSRDTAKNRGKDVRHALAKKFGIGAVLGTGHTVGHNCRKQGFDGTENGNRECRLEHLLHHLEANVRQVRSRETGRNVGLHADGHHAVARNRVVPAEDLHHDRRDDNRNQGAGYLRGDFRPQNADGEGHETNDDGIYINSVKGSRIELDLADGVGRVLGQKAQPKEVRDLAKRDNDGDTGGKAHRHGERDELDDGTELRKPENDEQNARKERRRCQAVVAVLAHDAVDNHDEGARGAANLEAGAAQQGNSKARDNRRVETPFRADAGGDGERDGERKRQNANDDTRHEVAHEVFLGVAPAESPHGLRGDGSLDTRKEVLEGFLGVNVGHLALRSGRTAPNLEIFTKPVKGENEK